jgi:hypothetical protein
MTEPYGVGGNRVDLCRGLSDKRGAAAEESAKPKPETKGTPERETRLLQFGSVTL